MIKAFWIAEELKLNRVTFECDSLEVILALQGLKRYEDWQALANITTTNFFLHL